MARVAAALCGRHRSAAGGDAIGAPGVRITDAGGRCGGQAGALSAVWRHGVCGRLVLWRFTGGAQERRHRVALDSVGARRPGTGVRVCAARNDDGARWAAGADAVGGCARLVSRPVCPGGDRAGAGTGRRCGRCCPCPRCRRPPGICHRGAAPPGGDRNAEGVLHLPAVSAPARLPLPVVDRGSGQEGDRGPGARSDDRVSEETAIGGGGRARSPQTQSPRTQPAGAGEGARRRLPDDTAAHAVEARVCGRGAAACRRRARLDGAQRGGDVCVAAPGGAAGRRSVSDTGAGATGGIPLGCRGVAIDCGG
eukprot:ctg_3719.g610